MAVTPKASFGVWATMPWWTLDKQLKDTQTKINPSSTNIAMQTPPVPFAFAAQQVPDVLVDNINSYL